MKFYYQFYLYLNLLDLFGKYLKVREVLVHRPGTELKIVSKPKKWFFSDFIDIIEMQREHDELVKVLQEEGVKIHYLQKPTTTKPKLYVINDSAIVLNKKAVTCHFIHSIRRGEEQLVKQRLRELGIKIAGHIFVPGFLQGSDIFFVDKNRAFAKIGYETNKKGIEHLTNVLNIEVTPIDIGDNPNTQLNFINGSVIINEDLLDTPVYNLIKEMELDMVTATRNQSENMEINFIQIDDYKIVNIRSDFNKKLRMIGYDVITVDIKELVKGQCGIRNMCLPFY